MECVRLVVAFTLGDLSPKVKAIINYRIPKNN